MSENDKTVHAEWGKTEHERYVDILEQWKVQREEIKRLQAIVAGEPERMLDMTRNLMREGPELAKVRDEIRLRSEVLRVFDLSLPGETISQVARKMRDVQFERFASLLDRERELMGGEWSK